MCIIQNMKRTHLFITVLLLGVTLLAFSMYVPIFGAQKESVPTLSEEDKTLPIFTESDLRTYDGTDPALPIYIGLDGYVYDVTLGKEYYAAGGRYHDLAGKDSSQALRFMGGDIIKEKYSKIGILSTISAQK